MRTLLLIVGVLTVTSAMLLTADSSQDTTYENDAVSSVAEMVINITGAEAKELLAKKEAPLVIDIRTAREFQDGHINGARMIDFFQEERFRAELAKLDRQQSYLVHCKSGRRSTTSLAIWRELGFTKIYHLNRGILDWKKAQGEIIKGR